MWCFSCPVHGRDAGMAWCPHTAHSPPVGCHGFLSTLSPQACLVPQFGGTYKCRGRQSPHTRQIPTQELCQRMPGSRHCSEGTDRSHREKLAQVLADPGSQSTAQAHLVTELLYTWCEKWLTRPGWEWVCLPADGHAARGSGWATCVAHPAMGQSFPKAKHHLSPADSPACF